MENQEAQQRPRWEKVLQRNFPPLAWTTGAYYEFRGFKIGPLTWGRGRELQVKYKTAQSFMIQDPSAYYISNINDIIKSVNPDLDSEIDKYNDQIFDVVRIVSGNTLQDLNTLNELHKLMYVLMLIGFDVVIDIKNHIDQVIGNTSDEFMAYLETPWKPTAVQREREAMRPGANTAELAKEYGYLHQDYLGQPWSPLDYEKALQDDGALESHMADTFDLNQYSEYQQWLTSTFKKFLYMYEEGRNAMVRCAWGMKEIMKSLGHDPETILYMTTDEVSRYAKGEIELLPQTLIEERKKAFALYFENGKYQEYSGEAEVKQLIDEQQISAYWEYDHTLVTSLKGAIAFKGCVQGKVRLVFTQADANAVLDGEIIVAPMTQVEFLSGIRKCGAIVTDEGGVICHAAIVAREFGKPCILATQKATKVFKTGDMVEVDANVGIVRILERA
jgi:phosphohistidine swiveling domain-containing protein